MDRVAVVILQNVLDLSYNMLKRVRLQYLDWGEGSPEYPWELQDGDPITGEPGSGEHDELAAGLAFRPGVVWYAAMRRTVRVSAEPYVAGDPNPESFYLTRHYVQSFSSVPSVTVVHELSVAWPIVQIVEAIASPSLHFMVYDIFGAGGTITHTDNDTLDIVFGATISGQVVVVG